MDELIVAVLLTTLPVAVWGTGSVVQARRAKRRVVEMEEWAKQNGFTFSAHGERESKEGIGRAIQNRMERERSGVRERIYDLAVGNSQGHHRLAVTQTIIELSSPSLDIPAFRLEPEHVLHKVAEAMGAQDIDFDSHPRFSDRYLLRGESEPEIRKAFTPAVLDWLEGHLGLTVDSEKERILVHRNRLLDASELAAELSVARELHDLFSRVT